MDKELDHGAIIYQEEVGIEECEVSSDVYKKFIYH